jgi:hypothetical protein
VHQVRVEAVVLEQLDQPAPAERGLERHRRPGNIGGGAKLAWALFSLIPVAPFLYVLTGGDLW